MTVKKEAGMDRRDFLKIAGVAGIATITPGAFLFAGEFLMMPNSEGFLVVDMAKCQGCNSCMTSCSLAHHGIASLSRSRIQIQQNSFAKWPDDDQVGT